MADPKRPLTEDEYLRQYVQQQTGQVGTLNPAGLRAVGLTTAAGPAVAPGYDANPNLRNAQAATDRAMQARAVQAANAGYDINPSVRAAQTAQDRAMQAQATAPLPVNTGVGMNPDVPATYSMARAASATGRSPDVPMVNTPQIPTVTPVTPQQSQARANTMQAQYDQPVTGPRTPATPVVDTRPVWAQGDIGSPLYNVGSAIANAQAPTPNAMLAGRFGSASSRTQAAASNTTPSSPSAPTTGTTVGASPATATGALDTNPTIRNAQIQAPSVAAIAALSPENQAVIAKDRANLKAAVDQLNTNFNKSNALMSRADAMTQGPTYANQRGNYSMTGTSPDVIADAARRSYTGSGGVNFGFAPGGARQYLDSMALKDEARAQRRAAIQADVERIGLRNAMTQGTPQERRAARQQMEALDARMNLGTEQTGQTARQRIATAGDIQRAGITAQASMAGSEMDAMSRLQAAQITGEYGLAGEQARVDATANDPDSLIKQQRMSLALAALQSGDNEAANRYLNGLSAPSTPAPKMQYTQDAMGRPTGVWVNGAWRPLTPQEQEGVTRVNAGYTPAQN